MKNKLLILGVFALCTITVQGQSNAHKDSLQKLVKAYYDLNVIVFQKNSKPSDVDQIFKLFTKDFTYTHPKYGGVYSRDVLYKGYLRNQKKGGYDGDVTAIKIVNTIIGLNSIAVEKRFITKEEGEGASQMTLFEFEDGKISKIFEYW